MKKYLKALWQFVSYVFWPQSRPKDTTTSTKEKEVLSMNIRQVNSDSPLTTITSDRFRRGALVEMIAKSIQDLATKAHPCVVYGIYGKWGEGKTSILYFIEEQLREKGKKDGITIVHFNPWIVDNEEALLREFFQSILIYPDEKVRQLFKKYGSLAIFASKTIVNAIIPGVGSALASGVESAKKALDDTDTTISQYKKKVSDAIKSSGKHLLVMIDDIDRLDKNEIHSVLRLIRQVADFENVIYLVAMDVDMVSKAISQYYGAGENFDGRKYIDKIVQVPITIPVVPPKEFESIVQEELNAILDGYAVENEIKQICKEVTPLIRTRRELIRYCNQLAFVLPGLKDEVNISDLCVLEAIKIISSEAYLYIYNNRSVFFHETNAVMALMDKQKETKAEQDRYDRALSEAVEGIEKNRRDIVKTVINTLFTRKNLLDAQKDYDDKRIYTSTYFAKYFTQLVPIGIIPDSELNDYLSTLDKKSVEEIAQWMTEKNEQYGFDEIERSLIYFIQHSDTGERRRIIASQLAIAVSVSSLVEYVPYHIEGLDSISSFVAVRLLRNYFTEQDPDFDSLVLKDLVLFDKTLTTIFERAPLNFSMNLLPSVNGFVSPRAYNCRKPVSALVAKFKAVPIVDQMKRSKYLLQVLFNNWKSVDAESFDEYANNLLGINGYPVLSIIVKFIDGPDYVSDIDTFVYLFEKQLNLVNNAIKSLTDEEMDRPAVKMYRSNYKVSLENMKSKKIPNEYL